MQMPMQTDAVALGRPKLLDEGVHMTTFVCEFRHHVYQEGA